MKNFFKEFETIFDIFSEEETFKVPDSSSIVINGNSIIINGKPLDISKSSGNIKIVVEGTLDNLYITGSDLAVKGNIENICSTNGDILIQGSTSLQNVSLINGDIINHINSK